MRQSWRPSVSKKFICALASFITEIWHLNHSTTLPAEMTLLLFQSFENRFRITHLALRGNKIICIKLSKFLIGKFVPIQQSHTSIQGLVFKKIERQNVSLKNVFISILKRLPVKEFIRGSFHKRWTCSGWRGVKWVMCTLGSSLLTDYFRFRKALPEEIIGSKSGSMVSIKHN